MNTRIRIIPWVMLVVGFILLSAGVAELYPLCRAARNCHHTVGIVQRVETKKNYRHRKLRYDTEMTVIYSTEKYGDLSVTRTSHWPFTRKGDEISVWYHPERPREVHLPVSEGVFGGGLVVIGALCIYGGCFFRKLLKTK